MTPEASQRMEPNPIFRDEHLLIDNDQPLVTKKIDPGIDKGIEKDLCLVVGNDTGQRFVGLVIPDGLRQIGQAIDKGGFMLHDQTI